MSGETFTDCSPIFVVGSGRSGTTLLQLMLSAHPAIAVAGELLSASSGDQALRQTNTR